MLKTNENTILNGYLVTIGINNVIIFHVANNLKIEFWKDEEGYKAGFAYKDNRSLSGDRYSCYRLDIRPVPKKWKETVEDIKKTYDEHFSNIQFINYI
jgi:hypothetical protein